MHCLSTKKKSIKHTSALRCSPAALQLDDKPCYPTDEPLLRCNPFFAELLAAVAFADGQKGSAALAASAARRRLARNAAGVKHINSRTDAAASACVSLVTCLPALESVDLFLPDPLVPDDLGCLLEALVWCPHLRALGLNGTGRR